MRKLDLELEDDLYPPMIAGVVVTYSKNFNSASGLGPLPSAYLKFPTQELRTAHEKILESRNRLYAHRDLSYEGRTRTMKSREPYSVEVTISHDSTAFLFQPIMVDISPGRMDKIADLLRFQMSRLQEELDRKLAKVVDFSKGYKQGKVYLLGKDFP